MNPESSSDPLISIVIPIYNEEEILRTAVTHLVEALETFGRSYELILAENGSRDRTRDIMRELSQTYPQVSGFSCDEPNYGKALKTGILKARGTFVICDEIDLCMTSFYRDALAILEPGQADLVVGSKRLAGASDERPLFRRAATWFFSMLLRVTLDFHGTDTHGLKAFRREPLLPILHGCIVEKDVFASEFVIRAERAKIAIREVPIRIQEKRSPPIKLLKRVPNVLKNLVKLFIAIRIKG